MIDGGKQNTLGILVDAIDYGAAVERITQAARDHRAAAVSAVAVHGVMTGVLDPEQKYQLNHFDILVPDGQPVRWALNLLYKTGLVDRVYGPNLMLATCERAAQEGHAVYLYGSTEPVLSALRKNLERRFPSLRIAGMEPSKFRRLSVEERSKLVIRIRSSGAAIVFVALGCPRQEVWAYEFREALSTPIVAAGAAFPFLAGHMRQAPSWMQDHGLEWFFRLLVEPKRLWRRYLLLNPIYVLLLILQATGLWRFRTAGRKPEKSIFYG
jgi:exopolysaccharide biosynthesis WecB/TagA/CpsF family protein